MIFRALGRWCLWLWHATDLRAPVDPIVDARIKQTRTGLKIAEDLQHNSRAGNVRALQHAAYCLDLPAYSVADALDTYLQERETEGRA